MQMIASKTMLDPQKLPPTEQAAYYHSLRVLLQVVKLSIDILDPKQWGWKLNRSSFAPIMTDLESVPENLLKFMRCKCKLSSKNPCGSSLCLCCKNGLKCVAALGDCLGENCNIEEIILEKETEGPDY